MGALNEICCSLSAIGEKEAAYVRIKLCTCLMLFL